MDTGDFLCTDDMELLDAGFPKNRLATVHAAEFAFWGAISDGYPECESGDTALTGEPVNAIAIWIATHLGIPLKTDRLALLEAVDRKIARTPRFHKVLSEAFAAAKSSIVDEVPDLQDPPANVCAMLQGCAALSLSWNLPEAVDND